MAHYYRARACYLVIEKLAEVFHIHFAFARVYNGGKAVKLKVGNPCAFHRLYNIGKLAHSGGLDKDTVGGVLVHHLFQSGCEISHKGAAYTPGIHLGNIHPCVLKKAAVDADVAELVLDNYKALALKGFGNELFYKRCFACAEKAGKNVCLSQFENLFYFEIKKYL